MLSPAYFQTNKTWSLLGYLKYREREDDFTSDKSTEHMSYVKNLEYLKENSKECQQIERCLCNLKYEKTSEDVNSFWSSINMKKQLDIKKLQCAGNALDAIANETHLRSVVTSEIISIMKQPLERSDDIYHNEMGSNVIIPKNRVISTNKRKREDQSDYEESALLFDESNEDTIMENIDEKTLEQEIKLPLASVNSSSKAPKSVMGVDIIEAFHKYQNTIPKTRRVFTPAYWGVLDLTGESLYDCKQFTEKDIMQQSQGFADNIYWKTMPPEKNIQQYFDSNCEKKTDDIRKLDVNVQFMKSDMANFQGMMTEEELKMSSTFPLFRGVFTSDKIKSTWGEVQALSTNYARNETGNPFKRARIGRRVDMKSTLVKTSNKFEVIYGEVAGGLGPFGIPTACRKKRYLDKLKLMIIMRDSINRLLKECKYVSDEKRKSLTIYGWLQIGLELNFYAMDWSGNGIYRFGLVDQCRLPSDEDECGMLEDVYCILKLLESKSLETEKLVKSLFLENTKGKRRQITSETEAELNINRSPQKQKLS